MSGGPAPFGMQWIEGQLVPNRVELPIVRELVEAFVSAGGRAQAAAAALNARGHRTRRGAKWSGTAVGRVVRSESLPGLIPQELWHRCETLLAERRGPAGRQPRRRSAQPLGGVVHCRCGGRMYARDSGASGKFGCRSCKAKIPRDTLERLFERSLASVELAVEELVSALADHPRAGELTSALGARTVPAAEVWPLLDPPQRCQLVDLLLDRIVVDRDEVRVVFAESGEKVPESAPLGVDSSTSSPVPPVTTNDATNEASSGKTRSRKSSKPPADGSRSILEPKAYRIQHVAHLLNLPKSTVYDMVRTGALASVRTGANGGVVLVPASAVEAFLERKRRRR